MTEPRLSWYRATVWMTLPDQDDWSSTRQLVELRAKGPEDFREAARALWPTRTLSFGPISLAKDQER